MFKNCVFWKKGFGNKNELFCFWVVSLTVCSLPEAFWKPFLGIRISSFTLTIFLLETRKTRQFETPFQIKAPRMMMVLIITAIKMMILIIMMMIVIITMIIIIYNNRLWIYESYIFELRIKAWISKRSLQ